MDTLIYVLLHLGLVCAPCTYYDSEIHHIEMMHEEEILAVKSDIELLHSVFILYEDIINEVIILDSGAEW